MRVMAIIVAILGVASLVLGILFVTAASSAEQEIADSIQPLTISEVDAKYDAVKQTQMALRMTEEPQIQAGKAAPSAMYNYLTIQRTSLGLTRSEIGLASFTRTSGIINIILGAGLILAGVGLLKRRQS
jgi:high-affinity Fe2+/Pb2+ permease